jgi:hypothetical protein
VCIFPESFPVIWGGRHIIPTPNQQKRKNSSGRPNNKFDSHMSQEAFRKSDCYAVNHSVEDKGRERGVGGVPLIA